MMNVGVGKQQYGWSNQTTNIQSTHQFKIVKVGKAEINLPSSK